MTTPVADKLTVQPLWMGRTHSPDKTVESVQLLFEGAQTQVSFDLNTSKFCCRKFLDASREQVSQLDKLKLKVEQIRHLKIKIGILDKGGIITYSVIPLSIPEQFEAMQEYSLIFRSTPEFVFSASIEKKPDLQDIMIDQLFKTMFPNVGSAEDLNELSTDELQARFATLYFQDSELMEQLEKATNRDEKFAIMTKQQPILHSLLAISTAIENRGVTPIIPKK